MSNNRTRESARNLAAVEYIRELKTNTKPRVTNEKIAEGTGINFWQVKRLLLNKADFTLDEYVSIVTFLGADPREAIERTLAKVPIEKGER